MERTAEPRWGGEENGSQGPWIVGTITTARGLSFLKTTASPADLVEVRLDALLEDAVPVREVSACLAERTRPALLTLRIPDEGGRRQWAKEEREGLLEELFPVIDALDLEYRSLSQLQEWWERARLERKWRIASVHWLEGSPGRDRILECCSLLERAEPDWAKIALRLRDPEDLRALARILLDHRSQAWALMGLGPRAALSRIVLSALGSELVYGYLDEPGAAGQPSADELVDALCRVGLLAASDRRMMRAPRP
ncbi:type I 3-dehydroquinate dehydratase [Methylacidimicrobium tartarophylax]|uniref:3-dehydroquinate dehydratase n=1 Tax=Methylacidimicrobium tartarophylax TaxID=1041768 RepID=A0A5E6MES5_9BACT|nr:type I 3-dehydroquinate dehydratase [Methylacidimicrobium tartarophylax]VVM04567.1 Catabolic 3-dehydroquinate dehydratase [Methylacidimicrobium tartarophylax]